MLEILEIFFACFVCFLILFISSAVAEKEIKEFSRGLKNE